MIKLTGKYLTPSFLTCPRLGTRLGGQDPHLWPFFLTSQPSALDSRVHTCTRARVYMRARILFSSFQFNQLFQNPVRKVRRLGRTATINGFGLLTYAPNLSDVRKPLKGSR